MKDVKTALYYASIAYILLLSALFLTGRVGSGYPGREKRGTRAAAAAGRGVLLLLWAGAALYVTVLSRLGRDLPGRFIFSSGETMRSYAEGRINLDPFRTVRNMIRGTRAGTFSPAAAALNIAGNLILFCPVAGCVRSFSRRGRILLTFLWSLIGSLAVEATQLLLTAGSFDVDDVILNAGGAVLFALILAAARGAGRRKKIK